MDQFSVYRKMEADRGRVLEIMSEIQNELMDILDPLEPITVLDIGACEGLSSLDYLGMFSSAHVVMFEPRIDNVRRIRDNFKDVDAARWEVNPVALSDCDGVAEWHVSYNADDPKDERRIGNKSSSLLRPSRHLVDHPWCKFKKERVNVRKLDSFGYHADFIHIDVQGAELKVFAGGENTLAGVKAVWMEVSKNMLYAGQPLKNRVERYMRAHGFVLAKDTCTNKWGDQLWRK